MFQTKNQINLVSISDKENTNKYSFFKTLKLAVTFS